MEILDEIDRMIDDISFEDRLCAAGITAGDALTAARFSVREYKALLGRLNIPAEPQHLMWREYLRAVESGMTDDSQLLLSYLLAGGNVLSENSEPEELISAWLDISERQKKIQAELVLRREKRAEFTAISEQLSALRQPSVDAEDFPNPVFNLLCSEGYADGADIDTLKYNLDLINALIKAVPALKPLSPLVYFQVYMHNRKKLLVKQDFVPTLKNLFNREEYSISADNGKNFDRYAEYCVMYLDLKKCFPEADEPLCDAGFLACSNLAEWCYENAELPDSFPLTDYAFVSECHTILFKDGMEEVPFWAQEGVSFEEIVLLKEKYSALDKLAEKAAQNVDFSQLDRFLKDGSAFCSELLEENGMLEKLRPNQLSAARALLMFAVQTRFEEELVVDLAHIINI